MTATASPPIAGHDEVLPGLWWLRGTRGCNVYLGEDDGGGLFLVDTGFASSAAAILDAVEQLAGGRPLGAILLTHAHGDHAGAAAAIREATGAQVIVGAGDCSRTPGGYVLAPGLSRRRGAETQPGKSVAVDLAVEGEAEVLPGVCAVPVPGHTPGSLVFISQRHGVAFAGDLVIVHGSELTRPLRSANEDDALYRGTLAAFARRAPGACLPGHGPPMLEGFDREIRAVSLLPRRHALHPRGLFTRVRRLAGFTRGISHRR